MCTLKPNVGQVSKKSEIKWNIEWSIKDILSYTVVNKGCKSPNFSTPDCEWHLSMFPCGTTLEDCVGFLSLYLAMSNALTYPKIANFSFGVKKKDGTIEEFGGVHDAIFFKTLKDDVLKVGSEGVHRFLHRSQLQRRMSELAPGGILTVTCTLRVKEDNDCIPKLVKLSADFKDMFVLKKCSDAILRVKDEEFSVHRSVLETRAPVFASVFDMKEKKTGVVHIADCDPEAFRDFLLYLYTGEHGNFLRNVFELYRISNKFNVQELKSECVSFILHNLSCENVFDAAILAHTFAEDEIKNKVQDIFDEHFRKIAPSAEWETFVNENPSLAVEMLKNMAENKWEMDDTENEG